MYISPNKLNVISLYLGNKQLAVDDKLADQINKKYQTKLRGEQVTIKDLEYLAIKHWEDTMQKKGEHILSQMDIKEFKKEEKPVITLDKEELTGLIMGQYQEGTDIDLDYALEYLRRYGDLQLVMVEPSTGIERGLLFDKEVPSTKQTTESLSAYLGRVYKLTARDFLENRALIPQPYYTANNKEEADFLFKNNLIAASSSITRDITEAGFITEVLYIMMEHLLRNNSSYLEARSYIFKFSQKEYEVSMLFLEMIFPKKETDFQAMLTKYKSLSKKYKPG